MLYHGGVEEVLCWLTSLSSTCWAKNTESICHESDVDYARENWSGVWGSNIYQVLFLLTPSLSVAFCMFDLNGQALSLLYKMTNPGSSPSSFKTSEIERVFIPLFLPQDLRYASLDWLMSHTWSWIMARLTFGWVMYFIPGAGVPSSTLRPRVRKGQIPNEHYVHAREREYRCQVD